MGGLNSWRVAGGISSCGCRAVVSEASRHIIVNHIIDACAHVVMLLAPKSFPTTLRFCRCLYLWSRSRTQVPP